MESNTCKTAEVEVNIVIGTLLDAAADKNDSVRLAVKKALKKIAKKHTNEVLITTCQFLQRNPKLQIEHVTLLLQPMEDICLEYIVEIDGDTVLLLINFCVNEMTKNCEIVPNVQMCLSSILVALGKKHCIQVMEGVLTKLEVGAIPHYTIPHTMGALASINAFGVLPFLKSILGMMLPMIGMLKNDLQKQSFAYAFGRFCEAINEYMSNISHAPDPTIQKDMFSTEISIAFDLLFLSWLQSREIKLTEVVLQAIGPMFSILTPEKIVEQTPRLINTLLPMYKKYKDFYYVSQCLASVLHDILKTSKLLIEPHIDSVLNTLSDIINPVPDYAQYEIVRNNSEVLRCFDRIAVHFCHKTVDHLLQMLKNGEKDRIKALTIITHLINSSDSVIKSRIPNIIVALKLMLTDQNMRIKMALLKTVVALAYHGHLFNVEGNIFIEFIIKLSCSTNNLNSKGVQEIDSTAWNEMKHTCDNSLYLLTITVFELENVLWCLFLDCLLNKEYVNATCTILKCLTNLASRKKEKMSMDSSEAMYLSNSSPVFVRCLILLARPFDANNGTYVLNFMKSYSWFVHKHISPLWDTHIPNMLAFLKENNTNDLQNWEERILDFLSLTITEIDEVKWTEELAQIIIDQMSMYSDGSEKELIFKCFAISLSHIKDVDCVKQKLDIITVGSFKFFNTVEARACSKAISICARKHLPVVLLKLNTLRKDELFKKSSKFLNFTFIKDAKHEIEIEKLRYTLLLCYAEVVLEAPPDKILSNIEQEILDWVVQELQNTKDFQIKKICLIAIGNVAKVMHPRKNTVHIRLYSRNEVIKVVLNQLQLHSGPEYIELFPYIIPVLTSLIDLRNELDSEQRIEIIKTCFDTIYNASAIYCKLTVTPNISYGGLKLTPYVYKTFGQLNLLVCALLLQNVSPATLDEIITMLEPWLGKKKPEQRLPVIENLKSILNCYLMNMKFGYEIPSKFGQTGFLLGRIVPRCTDSNTNIRFCALECVSLILCIAARYEGFILEHNNEITNSLDLLKINIETSDPKILYNVIFSIAKIISENLPQFQLIHFTESLLDGLLDSDQSSSCGASVVLDTLFTLKGSDLYNHVNDIILKLLNAMTLITCNKTRTGSFRAVLSMAKHHPKIVSSVLLAQPLPFETHITDCWMILSQEHNFCLELLEQFKHLFNTIPFYEEQPNTEYSKVATIQPLATICALHDMYHSAKMKEVVVNQLSELLAIHLVILSSYINVSPPIYMPQFNKKEKYSVLLNRPCYKLNLTKIAFDSLKMCLTCAKYDDIVNDLMVHSSIETSTSFMSLIELLPCFAKSVFENAPSIVSKLVSALNVYTTSNLEPQRIVAYGFFIEVLKYKGIGETSLNEAIIKTLLNGQTDSSEMVRFLVLRGLNYVSDLDYEQQVKHSGFILSALLQGLNDLEISNSEINLPLEALLGFSKMLHSADEKQLESVQISAAVRIKAFFEKDDPLLRAASFRLLGDLSRSFEKFTRLEAFREQVNGNFICLLLHLCDDDESVVKACKYTLRQITPFLDAKDVNNMIKNHLIDDAILNYSQFITDLVRIMVDELCDLFPFFILNALLFLKSQWVSIRGNAALLIGSLYNHLLLRHIYCEDVQLETICNRLLQLLQDEDVNVRAKAVQGLSYLFDS